jgi:photosystem II stability/assembly factor-like uncharacterized protein
MQTSGVNCELTSVYFASTTRGWAVGTNGTILTTSNGGSSWQQQYAFDENEQRISTLLNCVHFSSTSVGYAVGQGGIILNTSNGGDTWTPMKVSGLSSKLNGVYLTSSSSAWVVGDGGRIIHTTDSGANWSFQSGGITGNLNGVWFASADHGWAVGDAGTILATTNGGGNWLLKTSGTLQNLFGVHAADTLHCWVVGAGGTILYSEDGGISWTAQISGETRALRGVCILSQAKGFVVGQGGTILRTLDGGINWERRSSPVTYTLYSVRFAGSQVGWIAGALGTVLKTTDGGETWTKCTTGEFSDLISIDGWDQTHAWVAGDVFDDYLITQFLMTSNGGTLWQYRNSSAGTQTLYGLDFVGNLNGWAVGDLGVIVRTSNGLDWTSLPSPTTNVLNSVCFVDSSIGWTVGALGTILRTVTGGEPSQELQFIRDVFTKSDGEWVTLSAKVVSARFSSCFYMQEADRSSGVRVNWAIPPEPGEIVAVTGVVSTVGAERHINASRVHTSGVPGEAPDPLGLSTRALGGYSPGAPTPSVFQPFGPYNVGLYVRTWGQATWVGLGSPFFYIDDGSAVADDYGNVGVKVLASPPANLQVGDFVTVEGISGADYLGSQVIRVLYIPPGGIVRVQH